MLSLAQLSQTKTTFYQAYEYEVPCGITDVDMTWVTPEHLDIAYKGDASVVFEAIKCGGIDITIRHLSGQAASSSHRLERWKVAHIYMTSTIWVPHVSLLRRGT